MEIGGQIIHAKLVPSFNYTFIFKNSVSSNIQIHSTDHESTIAIEIISLMVIMICMIMSDGVRASSYLKYWFICLGSQKGLTKTKHPAVSKNFLEFLQNPFF